MQKERKENMSLFETEGKRANIAVPHMFLRTYLLPGKFVENFNPGQNSSPYLEVNVIEF